MILDEIMKYRARQLEREKAACGLEEMQKCAEKALAERKPVSLKAALRQDTLSCICEVKKASPSKGLIFNRWKLQRRMKPPERMPFPA